MKRDVSQFGPPQVSPGVPVDPRALQYQREMQERRQQRPPSSPPLPTYNTPVAGGPMPPMPRLDSPHHDGMTMADQAASMRTPTPGSIMESPHPPQGLLTSDILPEAARQDPAFRDGHGAMYAVNQPHLAQKYGVIRNGRPVAAQLLQQGRPGLSSKSVEGLEAVKKFNEERFNPERLQQEGDTKIEREAAGGPGGAAARLANGPGDADVKPVDQSEIKKRIEAMDDFDFNALRHAMMKDLLNNDEQRKIIEDRLEPLSLDELIMRGRVAQLVPVVPGKFEPEFQSMTAEEDLALKRLVMEETKSLAATENYILDKFSIMSVALGIRSINKKQLPDHLDKNGDFDDELFKKKFNLITKYPFHMIASLGVNYFWFDIRVRKLFVAEKIKNG